MPALLSSTALGYSPNRAAVRKCRLKPPTKADVLLHFVLSVLFVVKISYKQLVSLPDRVRDESCFQTDSGRGCVLITQLSKGATFKSVNKRLTKPGRRIIHANVKELDQSEEHVGTHLGSWSNGSATPLGAILDQVHELWTALPVGEEFVLTWPGMSELQPSRQRSKTLSRVA